MTSFNWFASLAPEGHAMCCLCFEAKPYDQLYVDDDGDRWDVCLECKAHEDEAARQPHEPACRCLACRPERQP